MFGFFSQSAEAFLESCASMLEGEMPTKQQLATLIDAGMTIYAISEATGLAQEVIERILEE